VLTWRMLQCEMVTMSKTPKLRSSEIASSILDSFETIKQLYSKIFISLCFYQQTWTHVRPSVCLSVVCLSVTLVHPTQAHCDTLISCALEIFLLTSGDWNFRQYFTPFRKLAICWHPGKILRRSSQGNPSVGVVKHKRGENVGQRI